MSPSTSKSSPRASVAGAKSPASPAKANWNLINRRWHANFGMFAALTLGLVALSCFAIAHKTPGATAEILKQIHFGKFLPASTRWVWIDLQGLLLLWLIVSGWLIHWKTRKRGAGKIAADSAVSAVILHEGDSPRALAIAQELGKRLSARRQVPILVRFTEHAQVDWTRVATVLVVADAMRSAGADAFVVELGARGGPRLKTSRMAVLWLDGTSAPNPLFDALVARGARPFVPTISAPAEDRVAASEWIDLVVAALAPVAVSQPATSINSPAASSAATPV